MRDLKWILYLLITSLLLLAIITILIPTVSAENNTQYTFHNIYRIQQGQTVYPNDTIDISGQGWGTGIAWYGTYGEYSNPQYIRLFTGFKKDVFQFWLDPSIFTSRTGMWYQYYGNATEKNGNLAAFSISSKFRNNTLTFPNGTTINQSTGISENITEVIIPETIVPEISIADYLIARGDFLQTNLSNIWLFGRTNGFYGIDGNMDVNQINSLEIGSYKLISQTPGKNTLIDVGYNKEDDLLWRSKYSSTKGASSETTSINGLQPRIVMNMFDMIISQTDDITNTYNLEVQDPTITIISRDEVAAYGHKEFYYSEGMTLLDIRGYTNVAKGTTLTFVLDPDKQNAKSIKHATFTTTTLGDELGNMRYYRIYIPINKNEMSNEIHTIMGSTAIGGVVYADFPVSEMPADSFIPNATAKYIGDRNPWVPTPTPEIIKIIETVPVPGPVQTVIITITPSVTEIREQQQKIIDEKIGFWIPRIITTVVGLIVLLYIVSIHLRRRKEQ